MKLQFIFLEEFGKAFVPKRMRPKMRSYFLKGGMVDVPFKLFGAIFYLALIITFIIYFAFVYPPFIDQPEFFKLFLYTIGLWTLLPIALTTLFGLLIYFYMDIKIFNRTRKMEAVLPDFLRFVSENLKGGMPFERALWASIRPEFGILAAEVQLAAKRVMTGSEVDAALREFTLKYNSPTLRRSFDLIVEGMKGGGKISDLIDRVVDTLEETTQLKKELTSTNITYMIFVAFVVLVVAPFLFTMSFHFILLIQGFAERIGSATTTTSVGLLDIFSDISVNPSSFQAFSRYSLVVMSFFSALMVSMISTGSIRGGIRYIPIFVIATQVIYAVMMLSVGSVFGSFFGSILA